MKTCKNLEFLSFFYHFLSFFNHFRESFNVFQNAGFIFGENLQKPRVFVTCLSFFIIFLILRNFWARMISSGKSLNHSHPSPSPSSLHPMLGPNATLLHQTLVTNAIYWYDKGASIMHLETGIYTVKVYVLPGAFMLDFRIWKSCL